MSPAKTEDLVNALKNIDPDWCLVPSGTKTVMRVGALCHEAANAIEALQPGSVEGHEMAQVVDWVRASPERVRMMRLALGDYQ
jgi:hypothetical protein